MKESFHNISQVILGTYKNDMPLRIIRENHINNNLQYFNIPGPGLPIEENGYPYFMVMNRGMKVSDVFTPDKSFPSPTIGISA